VIGIRPIIGPAPSSTESSERPAGRGTAMWWYVYCHELDTGRRAGGHGGGRSFAEEGCRDDRANITPDPETGAGTWTDDMLARAIREGIGHDGRALFPIMPYHQFKYMADEDVASVVVYLRSLMPLHRTLPPTAIPFPVNRFINAVPEPITAPVPQPDRTDPVAYGNYMVRLSACRDCHTPADAQGQAIPGMDFAGGFPLTGPYGKVASANITPAPSGIPYYTEELFLGMMRTGRVTSRKIHDAMPWAFYGRQTDEDLKAIFAYLKTLTSVQHRVDNTLAPTLCPRCGNLHGAGDQNQPATN
jgi:hypothetical protein